jgi:hypothetical protein
MISTSSASPTVEIAGLSSLEAADLQKQLNASGDTTGAIRPDGPLPHGRQGEPVTATIALVTIGKVGIGALIVWLAKSKSFGKRAVTLTASDGNGGTRTVTINETFYKEGKADAGAIKEAVELFLK